MPESEKTRKQRLQRVKKPRSSIRWALIGARTRTGKRRVIRASTARQAALKAARSGYARICVARATASKRSGTVLPAKPVCYTGTRQRTASGRYKAEVRRLKRVPKGFKSIKAASLSKAGKTKLYCTAYVPRHKVTVRKGKNAGKTYVVRAHRRYVKRRQGCDDRAQYLQYLARKPTYKRRRTSATKKRAPPKRMPKQRSRLLPPLESHTNRRLYEAMGRYYSAQPRVQAPRSLAEAEQMSGATVVRRRQPANRQAVEVSVEVPMASRAPRRFPLTYRRKASAKKGKKSGKGKGKKSAVAKRSSGRVRRAPSRLGF